MYKVSIPFKLTYILLPVIGRLILCSMFNLLKNDLVHTVICMLSLCNSTLQWTSSSIPFCFLIGAFELVFISRIYFQLFVVLNTAWDFVLDSTDILHSSPQTCYPKCGIFSTDGFLFLRNSIGVIIKFRQWSLRHYWQALY
jgi:hypothetical protein